MHFAMPELSSTEITAIYLHAEDDLRHEKTTGR